MDGRSPSLVEWEILRMKVFVLKDLPDGTPAGRVVDLPQEAVEIFKLPGVNAVRDATDDEIETSTVTTPRRRSAYQRRDLRADS
jgi:hypothetical protein